ncbi:NAD(P)/FAD-dependent oxidoreductase [Blastococcus brunescens]|uniref:FAD-dependent oxidoreductase n=1 Tax=Blastococcus brunescens TaxID=1564165 RepID=A0ABZ1BBH3_9ACTN|nr:FAD-dependent oxidoreductase [Blastococcus sp. BMG 8361]WRL66685.1 FAD-dependent oxidoreductase [Blastococcus sp. BMG 8361]
MLARCEVVDGGGEGQLSRLTLRNRDSGERRQLAAAALFVLIGAEPHTGWLADSVALDDRGFVLTGRDLSGSGDPAGRPGSGSPLPLETSMPGVFAAGDVRHGSVKRVAAAAGEGATAIHVVHEYLTDAADR